MAQEYEINEKDIDSVIRFLKIYDPDHANPEMAIEILENLDASFHMMAHDDPEMLEALKKEIDKQKLKRKDV